MTSQLHTIALSKSLKSSSSEGSSTGRDLDAKRKSPKKKKQDSPEAVPKAKRRNSFDLTMLKTYRNR